jgi:hypothetical protein
LACCVLNRKHLIAHWELLSLNERLEFIAENTDVIKTQIYNILKEESCKLVEVKDENVSARMTVQEIYSGGR